MAAASEVDRELMGRAIANAARQRLVTSPNPWVGAVVAATDGELFDGATEAPPGPHAEIVALQAAGSKAERSTVYTTLEPCNHTGRTGPCTTALIEAGVSRVVVGVLDPDPQVSGAGAARLRDAGIAVDTGICAGEVTAQLRPYLHHRRHGRPFIVLKLAATLDGRTAAADGSSQWITGTEARAVAHRLRAYSDAVCVGAGTVRADDPSLTVRDWVPDPAMAVGDLDPLRVVLGRAPSGAKVRPCLEMSGELADIVTDLGAQGVLQLMVEGGARTAAEFHRAGLVDRYEVFLAPAIMGGSDGLGLFEGVGARSIDDMWRGRIVSVEPLGADLHIVIEPATD